MHRSTARIFVGLLAIAVLGAPIEAQARSARDHVVARPRAATRALHVGALGVAPVRGTTAGGATAGGTTAGGTTAGARAGTKSPSQVLEYHGGPVMHSSTTYTIYWEPITCGVAPCYVDPVYNAGIDTYFADAAQDSGTNGNVYSTLNQYYDLKHGLRRHVEYAQTFGGTYVDTTPFPSNSCTGFHYGTSGVCLSDKQVRKEVESVITSQGWTGGRSRAFFLMLPKEVDTCYGSSSCAFTQFCAYHSAFSLPSGKPAIYANIPYAGTALRACASGKTAPNNEDLDATLNAASHEHREMTNDPFGTAWWDDQSANEGSDECAYKFGPDLGLGGPNNGSFNQFINGHVYLLQMEWSNKSIDCKQRGA